MSRSARWIELYEEALERGATEAEAVAIASGRDVEIRAEQMDAARERRREEGR